MSSTAGFSSSVGNGKGSRPKLAVHLLQVVGVDVGVAEGVDELAGGEPRHLRHHVGQEGIGGDVERHAEEEVGAALV